MFTQDELDAWSKSFDDAWLPDALPQFQTEFAEYLDNLADKFAALGL